MWLYIGRGPAAPLAEIMTDGDRMKIELDGDELIRHLENLATYCEENDLDLNGYVQRRITAL